MKADNLIKIMPRRCTEGKVFKDSISSGISCADVVRFSTSRFGEVDVSKDKIINFSSGLPGFPYCRRYAIFDFEGETPFMWLQSADVPELSFVIIDPLLIKSDYHIDLKKKDVEELGGFDKEDLVVLVILTIPRNNPNGMTANLKAPLIINKAEMKGKQVVLEKEDYPVRYKVLQK